MALVEWYTDSGRDLPWRGSHEPWAILVSEVMLQQTQVSRVVPAWSSFLGEFPTPQHLASSSTAAAITAWSDLGYQRRVINLRRSAIHITEHGWPTTSTELRVLPGVGPYTAAAVACFAFGEVIPAVDVNLRRVLSRWRGQVLSMDESRRLGHQEIDPHQPDGWNQAMMDLGATVCHRRDPACGQCPVGRWCSDPSIDIRAMRQSAYNGSVRQARATILRAMAIRDRSVHVRDIVELAGARSHEALGALVGEGVVIRRGDHYLLAP